MVTIVPKLCNRNGKYVMINVRVYSNTNSMGTTEKEMQKAYPDIDLNKIHKNLTTNKHLHWVVNRKCVICGSHNQEELNYDNKVAKELSK